MRAPQPHILGHNPLAAGDHCTAQGASGSPWSASTGAFISEITSQAFYIHSSIFALFVCWAADVLSRRVSGRIARNHAHSHTKHPCVPCRLQAQAQGALSSPGISARCSSHQNHIYFSRHRGRRVGRLLLKARRRDQGGFEEDDRGKGQGFGISQRGKTIRININGSRFDINRDSLWTLLVPVGGVLALAAAIGGSKTKLHVHAHPTPWVQCE